MSYQYPERKSQPGSAERNAQPIVAIVAPMLQKLAAARRREDAAASPDTGKSNALPPVHVLEVGSGEGVQLAALAQSLARMPVLFQPTEVDAASCHDVDTHCGDLSNVARCATLDIQESSHWQSLHDQTSLSPSPSSAAERQLCCAPYDAVLVLNIVHIVPWETVQALFAGVSAVQSNSVLRREAGIVLLYGAFREHGSSTGEGNEKFEHYLKAKDARFGLRDLQRDIEPLAEQHGLYLADRIDMPAGNLLLVFGQQQSAPPR